MRLSAFTSYILIIIVCVFGLGNLGSVIEEKTSSESVNTNKYSQLEELLSK